MIFLQEKTEERPLTGFDRLQEAGFSTEDIENMRNQFRRTLSDSHLEHGPVAGDNDEHARALEDQWMEGLNNQELSTETGRFPFQPRVFRSKASIIFTIEATTNEYMILMKGKCS